MMMIQLMIAVLVQTTKRVSTILKSHIRNTIRPQIPIKTTYLAIQATTIGILRAEADGVAMVGLEFSLLVQLEGILLTNICL